MSRTGAHRIGGALDYAALTGRDADNRMRHFRTLDRDAQAAAIRRMAMLGWSDHGISQATQLSVEFIRHVIGERVAPAIPARGARR
ncbi:MAG: hypothetical protein ACYDAE_23710 [Steroidobacteraceae bacterium]